MNRVTFPLLFSSRYACRHIYISTPNMLCHFRSIHCMILPRDPLLPPAIGNPYPGSGGTMRLIGWVVVTVMVGAQQSDSSAVVVAAAKLTNMNLNRGESVRTSMHAPWSGGIAGEAGGCVGRSCLQVSASVFHQSRNQSRCSLPSPHLRISPVDSVPRTLPQFDSPCHGLPHFSFESTPTPAPKLVLREVLRQPPTSSGG